MGGKNSGRAPAGTVAVAPNKRVRVVQVPDELPVELYDSQAIDANASAPLADLLATIGAEGVDAKVVVEKIAIGPGGQRTSQYLFRGDPSADLLDDLQRDYGEGRYVIKVYSRDPESGTLTLRANKTQEIGPLPASKAKEIAREAVAPTDRTAELIAEMRAMGERSNERMQQFMLEMVKALAGNKGSTMADFKDFAAGLGALPKPQQPKDPLEQLGALYAIIEKLRAGAGAAAAIADPETGEVPSTQLFLEGIRTVRELVTNARGAQSPGASPPALPVHDGSAAAAIPIPNASAQTPVALIPNAPQSSEEREMLMLRLYVQNLIEAAKQNAPVENFAGQVDSFLSDEAFAQLEADTWFETLCAITPVPTDLKPWFARLRDAVLELNPAEGALAGNGDIPKPAVSGNAGNGATAKPKRVGGA